MSASEVTGKPGGLLVGLRRVLTAALEWIVIIAVAALTLDVLWGVISRYFLGEQSRWTEELARVLLIWVSLLGTSVAFGVKGHLGVDFFVGLMDEGPQRLVRCTTYLTVIFFALSVMVWGGMRLVAETLRLEQMMMALSWLPKGLVYAVIPISGLFIAFFSLEFLFQELRGHGAPEESDAALADAGRLD